MKIIITDAIEAFEIVKQNPDIYRVLSIKNSDDNMLSKIEHHLYAKSILILRFDDKTPGAFKPKSYQLGTLQDCQQALDFLNKSSQPCIVHCNAGISRSTATVLGYLLQHFSYREAIDNLFKIRPCASPNTYIVKLMCEILEKKNYKDIFQYIEHKKSHYKGNMRVELAKKFLDYHHKQQK